MSVLLLVDNESDRHDPGSGMPDRPQRVHACRTALEQAGFGSWVEARGAAQRSDLEAVHDPSYLNRLETFCNKGGGWIDADTFAGPGSFGVSVRAAGAVSHAVDAVLAGAPPAFCLIRPPGHHATRDQAMGFCLINSIAVGAARALAAGVGKLAILDIDVHHGNGTQDIFWTDERVLYISLHQWPWYPWNSGDLGEIGEGKAEGMNVNIPLPEGCGDDVYEAALRRIVAPVVRQFAPEFLLVSAGFDAHVDDHLSLQRVSSAGFGQMASLIHGLAAEVCRGRLVLALEGGYNLTALPESVVESVKTISAEPVASPGGHENSVRAPGFLDEILSFHAGRWDLG